jgi:lipopolysaccharide export system protein LptA
MAFEIHTQGSITANGSEQTVTEISEATRISGYINLTNLQAGDTVVIRQYIKLFSSYQKYEEESYSDAQAKPIIYIRPKEIASGTKVTIQQTAGVFRDFEYKFIKEVVEEIGARGFNV